MADYFAARRDEIDSRLAGLANRTEAPEPLRAAFQAAAVSRGKRVRGTLTLAAGEACGARGEPLLDAAAGFELIHACSLILDDLPSMDDASLRRGEPALHRRFGEDLAILTAVGMLNQAYALITASHQELKPRRWNLAQVIERVVGAVGWNGTIGGQAVDLHSEPASLDFQTLEFIHSRKTGALFVAAASVGSMLANAAPATVSQIEAFAKNLGLAFQITDDILDVVSSAQTLGKDAGQDQERLTFVKLAGVEGARSLSNELVDAALAAIRTMGKSAVHLRELALIVRDRTS